MSKNALVLDDHYGDNGAVTAGMILRNITSTRFNELAKKGLVREATPEEVKAGDQHAFEKDESEQLREDGPTVEEYVAAGYQAANYPPQGYASRSTEAEITAAIAAQAKAGAKPEDKQAPKPEDKKAPEAKNKEA